MPVERLENGSWPYPARLPLGCGWSGRCSAPGHEDQIPSQNTLESFCNLGYAGECTWAPRERHWDAIRFAVAVPSGTSHGDSAESQPSIRVLYVCERSHRPVVHGDLSFDLQQAQWTQRHDDPRVQKKAECFLEAYLRKRS